MEMFLAPLPMVYILCSLFALQLVVVVVGGGGGVAVVCVCVCAHVCVCVFCLSVFFLIIHTYAFILVQI